MRVKSSNWREIRFSYVKTNDEGCDKMVCETYVVDAPTYSDAETSFLENIMPYVNGEYSIKAIAVPRYSEILFSDNNQDDKFYLANIQFITIDEKTEREKKTSKFYLVQANMFDTAKKYIEQEMGKSMCDYVVKSIRETNVMDVFE